ncbi:hypothetical protein WA1_20335 [Scytonema hofmannii PCC 7110]|uniref:Uncharacterized protein n=1 Tax=Scytonema hofmannii PCC 7110 TaxID=128403 RepID=A0A139XD22_9CYAN|nr:hypothetical protein [Scytonema hofmannii]KYC42601.1 hypothetical protein WA1_20335 [Scytonema hofmannii PCC 7110]
MTYADKLSPWCLVRLQSNMQNEVVARFRRRNDAEAHLQIMQRLTAGGNFTIIFNPVLELQEQIPARKG